MQDPNLVNRPPEDRLEDRMTPPLEDRGPTVISQGGGTGTWAVAVIAAVLVAVGIFYFVGSGTPGDGVDPNANTSAIGTLDSAPAGGTATDGQTGGATGGTQPLESQPSGGQPAEGGGATTTTP